MGQYRRLSKDNDALAETSEEMIYAQFGGTTLCKAGEAKGFINTLRGVFTGGGEASSDSLSTCAPVLDAAPTGC
jgi:hypothetical protein